MASYLVHDRLGPTGVKSVLSLDGALAIARARGLVSPGVTFIFKADCGRVAVYDAIGACASAALKGFDDLDFVRVWLSRHESTTAWVEVTKSEIDEHRNAGRAWKHHEFTMTKVWAVKIALSQTFNFPLESDTGKEWPEILELVVEEIFSSEPGHDEAFVRVFEEGREARRTAPTTGVRDVDCPYPSSDRRCEAWTDGYEAESIAIEAES